MSLSRTRRQRRRPRLPAPEPWFGRAFLLSLNLPKLLTGPRGLLQWVGGDPETAGTPVNLVLNAVLGGDWTAPASGDAGDVAFFHYAVRASAYIAAHRRAARRAGLLTPALADFLDYAAAQAEAYAGTVFAYAVLFAPTQYHQPDPERPGHWESRLMARLGPVVRLPVPLRLREHADVLPQPHSTITRLTARQFAALKERLVAVGNGPQSLLDLVQPGRDDADAVTAETWREAACAPDLHFADEQQLRGAFVDHLLDAIKDPGTTVHREVGCLHADRRGVPKADYLISLFGRWTPVEVKLNAEAWPGLLDRQVAAYVGVDAYEVRQRGGTRTRLLPDATRVVLIIDKRGLYAVRDGAYAGCALDQPLWPRVELGGAPAAEVRRRIAEAVGLPSSARRRRRGRGEEDQRPAPD